MEQKEIKKKGLSWKKMVVLVVVAAAVVFGYFQFKDTLTLDALATKESALRNYQSEHPVLVYGIGFLFYVLVTGLSLPGAAILTLVYGWFFGFSKGLLVVSFASTAGAALAFFLSRYLLRGVIMDKFGDRLEKFNQALEKEGAFYLFTLRLIPVVPFFIINLVMGLTPLRMWTFWWVSQVGMLAGTAVFVYAGSNVPSLKELSEKGAGGILSPQLILAFIILGVFPIVVKKIMAKVKAKRQPVQS